MAVLNWLLGILRAPFAVLFPFLGRAGRSSMLWRVVLWIVSLVVLVLILIGAHFLNQALHIDKYTPNHPWYVRENWLPILILFVYILAWLGWWLWRLLVTDDSFTEFPDITDAWEEAMHALAQRRIDLREVPLFLVVGRTEGSMHSLFRASKLTLDVKQAPAADDAPLHVYATRDAVYVTCEGASLLGRHAAVLAGQTDGDAAEPQEGGEVPMTLMPGRAGSQVQEIQEIIKRATAEQRRPNAEENRRMRMLMRKDRAYQAVVRNAAEVELLGARFEHLCRLLVRDRWPYCPINGMLVLLPFAATDTDQDALDAGAACQNDLLVARRVLQVNCPTLAMVCDLETAPGAAKFLEQFPEKQRQQRIGQRCPMAPALEVRGRSGDSEARADMLESLAQWIGGVVAPAFVYKNFQMESAESTAGVPAGTSMTRTDQMEPSVAGKAPRRRFGRADAVRTNTELFLFMHNLRERQKRLGRLLSRGFILEEEDPVMFGGCYLAATGADANRDQAFVAGVFHRLVAEENYVSWTTQARMEEDSHLRWALYGQLGAAALLVAVVAVWLVILNVLPNPFGRK
ncbi:MAG TPA: type VI secretion protein IcmF/TssM N-terminal domain-containing protein [Gemmataceae bacterium]|nr:type VI secretion protein IcmF/TssM N-terminal domain-containing protein [Gemmataceae bacterium]